MQKNEMCCRIAGRDVRLIGDRSNADKKSYGGGEASAKQPRRALTSRPKATYCKVSAQIQRQEADCPPLAVPQALLR